ncbi:sialidase family protein [soil metagenome]
MNCRILALLSLTFSLSNFALAQAQAEPRDEALQAPRLIIDPDASVYPTNERLFQGIPGLERSPEGRLWATWYGGGEGEGTENYVMLVTSDDVGRSWSKLKLVIDQPDSEVRCYDPCLWTDPDGRLWLFWAQSYRHFDGRCGVWAIVAEDANDADTSWSEPRRLCDGILMNKPTVLSSGDWLLPTAIWRIEDSCRVVASTDKGETWTLRGAANIPDPEHRNCDEPMIVERQDGNLWLLARTRYGIGESHSSDGGKTWSPVEPTAIEHPVARFFVRRLNSGNLLLVKHGPIDEVTGREQLLAFVSRDDGESWEGGLMLDERRGISYPDGVEAPDGTISIIYDRDRKGALEILMATFTEADALAGKPSESTRLRVLVNRSGEAKP